jgi:ribose 5-phosphate isomerase B
MNIALGTDHAGYHYKERIKQHLQAAGHTVRDFGTDSDAPVDYPDFIRPAALAVASGECQRGIVLGGSGNGEAMVANRIPGIRCAVVFSDDTARWASAHNNANCLSIGSRTVTVDQTLRMIDLWLATSFEGGRHQRRIEMIDLPRG